MIIWDKDTKILVLQGRYEQDTPEENVESQLNVVLAGIQNETKVDNSQALLFGVALLKHILSQTVSSFKPRLGVKYHAVICPSWTHKIRRSRFTEKDHEVVERPFLRVRLKMKPLYTDNRLKIFIQLKERLRDPLEAPVDHGILVTTSAKVKATFVEKLKTVNTKLEPPMGQYKLAKVIKSQLNQVSTKYPLQIRVHVDQREEKDRLIINGELEEVETEKLGEFFSDLLEQLESYFIGGELVAR